MMTKTPGRLCTDLFAKRLCFAAGTEDCGWSAREHALPAIAHNIARLVGDIREQNDQLGLDLPSDFCADVFCRPDLSVELIELNSYGAQMAADSCLFHWIAAS